MPQGAGVIEYRGPRGVVWRIKYRDASGRQVKETLGPAADGWNRRRAAQELRARLTDVARAGYRKPTTLTFAVFAEGWADEHADARALKRSTREAYKTIISRHLVPAFGCLRLEDITVDRIEQHLAAKRRSGLAPATLHRQLATLSLLFGTALRRGLVRANPVPLVERPKAKRHRWRILAPTEVNAVERAFGELISEAANDRESDDLRTARLLFLTMMGSGIRRGEALGLRWRSVLLADPAGPALRVEETWVRSAVESPKSAAGERTIALGPRLASELFDHRAKSPFGGEVERVFANPRTGNPFGAPRYGKMLRQALLRAGVEGRVRPFHDLRHSSITNAAAAGTPPEALMARAGHSDYATTRRYVDLAGERFRDEADRLERRLWGETGTKNRYKIASPSPAKKTNEDANPVSS